MKEFVSGASVRLAELEDLFVDMKARVRYLKKFNQYFNGYCNFIIGNYFRINIVL